eukprot:gnl/TRDRNA2_/TRDRNA2_169231_c0_seq2.p1 gnl/TRDRNA2_/TRDRNA2_169231_c0~~gnl/TRDRNA2_/TRDRNA2_169231_c0_seq2.p1  ORF type:complete len:180 (+),score=24.74 gnl/TRDRNA2_/TRDRNA2_169231_c0_seq2:355-894(+)
MQVYQSINLYEQTSYHPRNAEDGRLCMACRCLLGLEAPQSAVQLQTSKNYRFTFNFSAGVFFLSALVYSPLLMLVPRKEDAKESSSRASPIAELKDAIAQVKQVFLGTRRGTSAASTGSGNSWPPPALRQEKGKAALEKHSVAAPRTIVTNTSTGQASTISDIQSHREITSIPAQVVQA